ncbi:DUF4126 domain-containing protein [Ramlibacter rhizophilus]|uniref:DUF4126 domain-containing protein n=1 Tax=Ramlibacter rhizophilus TaxID=1781167 RepID=A0A4Z0BJJ8_9BURK|nr:DUF4126 domain-containing protein [Ramlibacter rhizophilus]TFY99502.1 DUF4126 domain-containing protein [Ramlibacter rhizophilus]
MDIFSTLPDNAPELLALAAALGWASGIRLYAVLFLTGLAGTTGWIELPPGLAVLQHPAVLGASGFMLFVEFFADKIPLVDSLWDAVHTIIRIPAGAALAAGTLGADGAAMATIAALVGGGLAATAHTAKMSTRAAVNTSPEPFSNVGISLLEDGFVVFMLWLSATNPLLFALVLALSIAIGVVLIVVLFKFLRTVVQEVQRLVAGRRRPPAGEL